MSNQDLIERLNDLSEEMKKGIDRGGPETMWHIVTKEDVDEAIAALSPVLPEDVRATLSLLRRSATVSPEQVADLIERLARENASLHASMCNDPTYAELRRRIEELEKEYSNMASWLNECREEKAGYKAQIAKYENLVEDAADRLKEVNEGMAATVVITELERIRGIKCVAKI